MLLTSVALLVLLPRLSVAQAHLAKHLWRIDSVRVDVQTNRDMRQVGVSDGFIRAKVERELRAADIEASEYYIAAPILFASAAGTELPEFESTVYIVVLEVRRDVVSKDDYREVLGRLGRQEEPSDAVTWFEVLSGVPTITAAKIWESRTKYGVAPSSEMRSEISAALEEMLSEFIGAYSAVNRGR
jgi:hypothetical protein